MINARQILNDCLRTTSRPWEASGHTVYIAGPISGDLLGNLPVFFKAEEVLNAAGHATFNPARCDGGNTAAECIDLALKAEGKPWADYMRQGITGLMHCDSIALLDGWAMSRGAQAEQRLAAQLGYYLIDPSSGDILRKYRGYSKVPDEAMPI